MLLGQLHFLMKKTYLTKEEKLQKRTTGETMRNVIIWLIAAILLAISAEGHVTDIELSAVKQGTDIVLSWAAGPSEPQVYKVWRATLPDMSDRVKIATVFGNSFTDETASGILYFYQIERTTE